MDVQQFDYHLPPELIAQTPIEPRHASRLMVIKRRTGEIAHHTFANLIDLLHPGDIMIANDSRVIPARLGGRRVDTGGRVEILLLRRLAANVWETLVKPGKRLRLGGRVKITSDAVERSPHETGVLAEVIDAKQDGIRVMRFSDETLLPELGKLALPPYIHTSLAQPERYQTVYSRVAGSVAAPTAGLHFTPELLGEINQRGVHCLFVTLHVGLDTFHPVRTDDPLEHPIHKEYAVLSPPAARELSLAKREGRRVICVGTTSVRIVEQAAQERSPIDVQPFEGWVNLFILPGYQFRIADALVTNFHLPRSTLLMLVSAFAGKELIDKAYQEAIARNYRFYSFGDAMLIL